MPLASWDDARQWTGPAFALGDPSGDVERMITTAERTAKADVTSFLGCESASQVTIGRGGAVSPTPALPPLGVAAQPVDAWTYNDITSRTPDLVGCDQPCAARLVRMSEDFDRWTRDRQVALAREVDACATVCTLGKR